MAGDMSRRTAEIERLVAQARLARSRHQAELVLRAWRTLRRLLSRPGRSPTGRTRVA